MVLTEETADDPTVDTESTETEQKARYVSDSPDRQSVLARLVDGPAAAAEVAANGSVRAPETGSKGESVASMAKAGGGLSVANAETSAEALRDAGLVELLEADGTRAYCLTAMGERVLFALERGDEN